MRNKRNKFFNKMLQKFISIKKITYFLIIITLLFIYYRFKKYTKIQNENNNNNTFPIVFPIYFRAIGIYNNN